MLCNGDNTQICGGSNRLTAFKYVTGDEPATSATPTATSTPTATEDPETTPTQTNTATATATGVPEGFEYKGCYVDGPGFRIMNNQQNDDAKMTVASCAKKCDDLGYTIAGMEYGVQCFCDNIIRFGGKLATADTQCGMACAGNANEKCGGPDRLSVWSSQETVKVVKKPVPTETVDGWKYQGCIADPPGGDRLLPWQLINKTGLSPEWCLSQCKEFGYMAGGMEFGEEW
jgi:hypothetical protein